MAVSDVGVYENDTKILTGALYDRRPDAVWIDREKRNVSVIAEVESTNLVQKAEHLTMFSEHIGASQKSVKPVLSVLVWWGDWIEDQWKKAKEILRKGFKDDDREYYPLEEPILAVWLGFREKGRLCFYDQTKVVDYLQKGISITGMKEHLQSLVV